MFSSGLRIITGDVAIDSLLLAEFLSMFSDVLSNKESCFLSYDYG